MDGGEGWSIEDLRGGVADGREIASTVGRIQDLEDICREEQQTKDTQRLGED